MQYISYRVMLCCGHGCCCEAFAFTGFAGKSICRHFFSTVFLSVLTLRKRTFPNQADSNKCFYPAFFLFSLGEYLQGGAIFMPFRFMRANFPLPGLIFHLKTFHFGPSTCL